MGLKFCQDASYILLSVTTQWRERLVLHDCPQCTRLTLLDWTWSSPGRLISTSRHPRLKSASSGWSPLDRPRPAATVAPSPPPHPPPRHWPGVSFFPEICCRLFLSWELLLYFLRIVVAHFFSEDLLYHIFSWKLLYFVSSWEYFLYLEINLVKINKLN